jgi:hypothetical protein
MAYLNKSASLAILGSATVATPNHFLLCYLGHIPSQARIQQVQIAPFSASHVHHRHLYRWPLLSCGCSSTRRLGAEQRQLFSFKSISSCHPESAKYTGGLHLVRNGLLPYQQYCSWCPRRSIWLRNPVRARRYPIIQLGTLRTFMLTEFSKDRTTCISVWNKLSLMEQVPTASPQSPVGDRLCRANTRCGNILTRIFVVYESIIGAILRSR